MTKKERIDKLYTELSKAETRAEVGRIIAELRAEGVNIPVPKPVNGPTGKKAAEAERRVAWMMKNIHRLCAAIPYGESSWCYGYIHGVSYDAEDGVCLYAVWLDDGRRIVKRDGAESLRILSGYHARATAKSEEESVRRESDDFITGRQAMKAAREYIGCMTEIEDLGPVRIVSVTRVKGRVMYRLKTADGDFRYRYPKPGMKYWKDDQTEGVAALSAKRRSVKTDLASQMRMERDMLDKADGLAREFAQRAETHRRNIEELKRRMAEEYQAYEECSDAGEE